MKILVENIEVEKYAKQSSGVYAIVQPKEKKVYVGLAFDFYHRWLSHINSIASGENKGSNDKLVNEPEKEFIILRVWYPETNLDDNEKQHDILLNHETLVMHAFRTMGYELYNGNENGKDDLGNKRKHLILSDELQENVLREYTKSCLRPNYENFDELLTLSDNEKEEIFLNAIHQANSNISLSEFEPYKEGVKDSNFYLPTEDGIKLIKEYITTHIPFGPYQSNYYFLKR